MKHKKKECPFCYRMVDDIATFCQHCKTAFHKKAENRNFIGKHGMGKGDTARKSDSDYNGGYVD